MFVGNNIPLCLSRIPLGCTTISHDLWLFNQGR